MDRQEHLAWLKKRLAEVESKPQTRLTRLQANSFRVMIRRIESLPDNP